MPATSRKKSVLEVDDVKQIEDELGRAVGQNGGLRSALDNAKEAISLQDETIKALTEDRYALATVLSFEEMRWREPRKDELVSGNVVKIKGPRGETGKIIGFDEAQGKYQVELFESQTTGAFYGNSSKFSDEGTDLLLWRPAVARIAYEGKVLEVPVRPPAVYRPGQTVRMQVDNFQICSGATEELAGEIARVQRRLDERTCEVSANGSSFVVRSGVFEGNLIEEGDRVALDRSGQIIVRKLGKSGDEYLFSQPTGVAWDDIGGLEEAKRELREAIELPHAHKKAYEWLEMKPPKGFLLFGPPGCGKTLLGKAAATSLAQIYTGKTDSSGFFYVKGPEFLQRYVGDSEAKVREVFANAAKFKERNGYPAIIFIDEAESILRRRGSGISSDVENTIVPMFLTMMDGLSKSGAIVMLTTNRADMLDPAVLREGRVDRRILITRPSLSEAEEIFRIHLRKAPLADGNIFGHAASAANELFNPQHVLYRIQLKKEGRIVEERFCLSDLVSGAMIAGIVSRAKTIAFRRYVMNKRLEGVSERDLKQAIQETYNENLRLKNSEALEDFIADYRGEVVALKRVTFAR